MESAWFFLALASLAMPFVAWRKATGAERDARALSARVDRLWGDVEDAAPSVRALRREVG